MLSRDGDQVIVGVFGFYADEGYLLGLAAAAERPFGVVLSMAGPVVSPFLHCDLLFTIKPWTKMRLYIFIRWVTANESPAPLTP